MDEITPKEAASRLNVSVDTIIRMLKRRRLGGINKSLGRKRGRWFVDARTVERFKSIRTISIISK